MNVECNRRTLPAARMADYLDLIKSSLPRELVSATAYSAMRREASQLPGAQALTEFVFECDLDKHDATADFIVSLKLGATGRIFWRANCPITTLLRN